ncbi:MAG: tetratricopeptide repeat protein [Alphaproteobacteria bacterium]|nr:tetratricopeptide repeat protein [Alphaproteobacteria bacterium]
MQGNDHLFPYDSQREDLATIGGVNFTPRETDILSCIVSVRSTKKISCLLSISPYTVDSHICNIKLKLRVNSKEGIIDFIEQSQTLSLIRKHYVHLSIHAAFENCLRKIAKEKKATKQICLILYGENQEQQDILRLQLSDHLKKAGIDAKFKNKKNNNYENTKELKNKVQTLLILLEVGGQEKIPKELFPLEYINFSEHQNYYFFVCAILKKLLYPLDFRNHFQKFSQQAAGLEKTLSELPFSRANKILEKIKKNVQNKKMKFLKNKKWYLGFVIFSILPWMCILPSFKGNQEVQQFQKHLDLEIEEQKGVLIRSDLPIPVHAVLLERSEELIQISEKLKGAGAIETIALVGAGGIGKTILSRQYARRQKAQVIWEINAETPESLKSSFEDLAQLLAITEKDQRILVGFQDIKGSKEREKKLIQFVKHHLKAQSTWLLIYDNVEKFQNIQPYFPQNVEIWGEGKVIITTRNSHIQNNKYVNSIIQIKELTSPQKLTLFMKIATNGNPSHFTKLQEEEEEAKQFLEKIPSFPLDVSLAAYYLKTTNISYDLFLENLNKNKNSFQNTQEKILKEAGDYIKTRYGIITLSLQNLINTHKDFSNLLLFLSLLDSQHIPRSLLDTYQNDIHIMDDFIFDLKKYSFITNDSLSASSRGLTFSIHRSTQEIILNYLIKLLDLENNHDSLQMIAKSLEKYTVERIEKEDLLKLRLLVRHCEMFLSHRNLLTKKMKSSLIVELGGIYLSLGNYEKAKQLLEGALTPANQKNVPYLSKARALSYLGNVYGDMGKYEKAQSALEQSLLIYKKSVPEHSTGIARTLASLGNVHRDIGNYRKSRDFLEKSVLIYHKNPSNNPLGEAWASACLGIVYTILGEYEKAKNLLEQSLLAYKKYPSKNGVGVAWVLAHLGDVHGQLGEHEKAKALLEQSIILYEEHFPEGHIKMGWALSTLGEAYRALGEYEKAKDALEQSLKIYKKHLSENQVVIAGILVYLGAVHKDLEEYEKAKMLLEQSLLLYTQHFPQDHNEIAWALAHLGDIHRVMGQYEEAKALLEKSLLMYRKFFTKDHVEVVWATNCLKKVFQELGEHGGAQKEKF